jgi:uncharacterized membrane protein
MIPSLTQLVAAMVALALVDALWLFTAGQYALQMTERIQGSPVQFGIVASIVVYVALAYLVYQVNTPLEAGLLGAATYAVYDFTSLAILKKYEVGIAIADTVWGSILFATVFSILKYFKLN